MPKKFDYYILETDSPEFTVLDMGKNPEYAALIQKEKNKELKVANPRVVPRAVLFQTHEMLYNEEVDEESGKAYNVFRPEVLACEPADSRGRLYLEKGQEMLVRRLIRELKGLGRDPYLDESGLQLPENKEEKKSGRPTNEERKTKNK